MTRKLVSDLLPGTNYVVRVRAVTSDGVSEWSPALSFQTSEDLIVPRVPANVSWAADGSNFVAGFDPVVDNVNSESVTIARYEIELSAAGTTVVQSVPAATTRMSYTLDFETNKSLFGTPRASVSMRVRAVTTGRERYSDWSNSLNASNPAPAAPTAPSVGNVVTPGADQLTVAWTASVDTDVIAYNVYVGGSAGFTPSSSNRVYSGMATRFTYTTTNYSQQYFKIRAVDVFGQESADLTGSGTATSPFTLDTTAPGTPTSPSATITNKANGIGSTASLSWTMTSPPSDLAGFFVRYRKVGDTQWYSVQFDKDSRAGTVDLNTAFANYEFQIKAFDWYNNESAWSAVFTGTAPANAAPSDVTGFTSTAARDGIRYDWTPVSDEDLKEYEITFSTSSTFASGNTTFRASGNTMTVSGLTPATTYYARIRAVDRQGLTSANWSATNTRTTLSSSSTISVSDLTGGTFSAIDMFLGPGSNLIANGGAIKSNTYTGTTASNSNGSAGFYMGNDGLTINRGTVRAEALSGGTFNAGTINIASGGAITGGSWSLSSSGLSIPDGGITAAKLLLQTGQNLVPAAYSDFEMSNADGGMFFGNNIVFGINNTAKFGSKSLGTLWGTQTTNPSIYMGRSETDYNISMQSGLTYIFSAYVWCAGTVATNVQFKVKWSTGAISTIGTANLSANGTPATATRLTGSLTAPAGATGGVLFFESSTWTASAGFNADGIMVEEKTSNATTPSNWKPGSSTLIAGGQIRTGEMRSNAIGRVTDYEVIVDAEGRIQYTNPMSIDNPSGSPAWSINLDGSAQFSNAFITGNVIVGPPAGTNSREVDAAVQVVTTSGSNQIESPNSDFRNNDVGRSITATGIPAGATIASFISETTATISANATASGTVTAQIKRPRIARSVMSSSNYSPGLTGWMLSSDGSAELLQLSAESIKAENIKVNQIDGTHFASTIQVNSVMQFGTNITLDDVNGIIVTSSNGKTILPTDGRDMILAGNVNAASLTITNNMALRGKDNEIAKGAELRVSSGTTSPKTAPELSVGWSSGIYGGDIVGQLFSASGFAPSPRGTSNWLSAWSLFGGGFDEVTYNSSTGKYDPVQFTGIELSGPSQNGRTGFNRTEVTRIFGLATIGNIVYILAGTDEVSGGAYRQFVYRVQWNSGTSSWSYLGRWEYSGGPYLGGNSKYNPTIGVRGTNVVISQSNNYAKLYFIEYNPTNGAEINRYKLQQQGGGDFELARDLTGVGSGTFDFGVEHIYVASPQRTYVFAYSNKRYVSTYTFDAPAKDSLGTVWDSLQSRFKTKDARRIYNHSTLMTGTTVSVANSWVKSNGTSPRFAQYETNIGLASSITIPSRASLTVVTMAIPDSTEDPANSPDAANIYARISGNSTYYLQATPRGGATGVTLNNIATSGTAPTTSLGFPVSTPGKMSDATGAGWILSGDSSGKMGDLLKWDSSGRSTMPSIALQATSANQTVANTTTVTVQFANQLYSYGNISRSGTTGIVINEPGVYAISSGFNVTNGSTRRSMQLMRGSTCIGRLENSTQTAGSWSGHVYREAYLNAGDVLTVTIYQADGSNREVRNDIEPLAFFTATRIR